MACGNCHGADGRGRPEGAVVPTDITWEDLTKPYGHVRAHRRHRAYTEASLGRAVNEGLDPDGNMLDWSMPRYALSRSELAALIEYMKRLSAERDPGIAADHVRIGAVLPHEGAAAKAVRAALEDYLEGINRAGGIHQRRLELVLAKDTAEARTLFAAPPVFAVLSPLEWFEAHGMPTVAAFDPPAGVARASDALAFSVLSGPTEHAALLVEFAARRAGTLRPAILAASDRAQPAEAAATRCEKRGCADLLRIGWRAGELDAAETVRRLGQARREQIFFFGAEAELVRLLEEVAKDPQWRPSVYAPGALGRAAARMRKHFPGELFFSISASPRAAALSAAAVLAEGLRRAGRDLSRERFVRALESLNNYDPHGHGPPVSFGPDRRTGARGGYVVALDRSRGMVPASHWIGLD